MVKARRALDETRVVGVKTNLNLLKAILVDETFASGHTDTSWLERRLDQLVQTGEQIARETALRDSKLPALSLSSDQSSSLASGSGTTFRKGDAWSVVLEEPGQSSSSPSSKPPAHHLSIERSSRNEFPEALVADVAYTIPGAQPRPYKLTLNRTTASADATASTHRRGDPSNKAHIVLPISGKLVEVLVQEGDEVRENQVIAFVRQMKMELEVRSPRAGTVKWAIELEHEDGDDVAEGVLLAELEDENTQTETQTQTQTQTPELKSRL